MVEARIPDDEPQSEFSSAASHSISATPFGWIVDGLNALGSVLVFVMMTVILADVVGRGLFNKPIHGVAELIGMAVIVLVFSQLASTLRHGRMARAELFLDPLKEHRARAGFALQGVFELIGVFCFAVIVFATWPVFVEDWTTNDFKGTPGLFTAPTWPMTLVVVVGATLTGLQYLTFAVASFRHAFKGRLATGQTKVELI
jgi:TRAP-type mannitol/chloroaromatic compound transport system permease small subunit